MKRVRVGIDIDGVLAGFVPAARIVLKDMLNGRPDDALVQKSWSFESLGITKQEENAMWRRIDETKNWWTTLPREPGTTLLKAVCDTCNVVFVTNRKDGNVGWPIEEQSQEWLKREFHINNPTVLIMDEKGPLLKGLKLDYFIDDRPRNVEDACTYAPECKTALLDCSYNQEYPYGWRVRSFDDFARAFLPLNVLDKVDYTNGRCAA